MAEPSAKDARYRPFRIASYAFYLIVTVVFSVAITVNVVRSTLAMTPDRPPPSTELMTPSECLTTARSLWSEPFGLWHPLQRNRCDQGARESGPR